MLAIHKKVYITNIARMSARAHLYSHRIDCG